MVKFNKKKNSLVCSFTGRLDTQNCMQWQDELIAKVKELKFPVCFDLQGVNYIASSFLRVCLKVAKEVKSENLSLINLCPSIKKVFKIAGFDKQLNIN
ncbi:MAG: STAS domain-containing protein [Candidatus Cloacimonetes bacterium]|nr:STAS domain-containing protein [Candidatus Cloacimonadota bacterium]